MGRKSDMSQRIYDTIVAYLEANGYPPSVREIGEAVGLRSPSTVHFHLKKLADQGLIEKGSLKGRALSLTHPVETQSEEAPSSCRIPILGQVAAGYPILAEQNIEDYLTFDTGRGSDGYFALRVRGYSMKDAGILPEDLVVVRQQSHAESGEIVVALLGEDATVKRLKITGNRVLLMPENPEFDPIDGRRATILGKVTAVIREY